eukprot:ANDGO_03167.mRNA.1 Arrestin domain-containing protein C
MGSSEHRLTLTVLYAVDLPIADVIGTTDPYVVANIAGRDPAVFAQKTAVVHGNWKNPTWNHTMVFEKVRLLDSVVLTVFDWDSWSAHDVVGIARISLSNIVASVFQNGKENSSGPFYCPLESPCIRGAIVVSAELDPLPVRGSDGSWLPPTRPILHLPCKPMTSVPGVHIFCTVPGQKNPVPLSKSKDAKKDTYDGAIVVQSGDVLRANVIVLTDAPVALRSLCAYIKGTVKGHKAALEGELNNGILISTAVNVLQQPCSSTSGNPDGVSSYTLLQAGRHVYPLDTFFPDGLPSSAVFKKDATIKYKLVLTADIVDRPDVRIKIPIRVISPQDLSSTNVLPDGNASNRAPVSMKVSKTPLLAPGPVTMEATLLRGIVAPGQEIELKLHVENQANSPIRNVDVMLERLSWYNGPIGIPLREPAFPNPLKVRFDPPICRGDVRDQLIIVELPSISSKDGATLVHSFSRNKFAIAYEIAVTLDIPQCRDISMAFPVTVKIPMEASASRMTSGSGSAIRTAAKSIDSRPQQWHASQVLAWATIRGKLDTTSSLLNIVLRDLEVTGRELLTVSCDDWKRFLEQLLSGGSKKSSSDSVSQAGGWATKSEVRHLVLAHRKLIRKWCFPRLCLAHLGMEPYADVVERADISYDEWFLLGRCDSFEEGAERLVKLFGFTYGAALRLQRHLHKEWLHHKKVVDKKYPPTSVLNAARSAIRGEDSSDSSSDSSCSSDSDMECVSVHARREKEGRKKRRAEAKKKVAEAPSKVAQQISNEAKHVADEVAAMGNTLISKLKF